MTSRSIDKILKDDLKLDAKLLTSSEKIKKLYITDDGDIVDNNELANKFTTKMLSIRDKAVSEWYTENRMGCDFTFIIYNPNSDDKFIEIISKCIPSIHNNIPIFYKDYIKVYDSDDNTKNNKLFGINKIESLLFYLKTNGLIKDIKYNVKG